jgi:hypothetical protein
MTPFEYVIVLISVILGLGITTILTGVAELIKHTRSVGLYTPYIIWIVLIFVLHIQDWWISYKLKSVDVWTLHFFLLIVLYPINLYILAHLLFPASLSKDFRSKDFYLEYYPRFFIGAITLVIISITQNLIVDGLPVFTQIPHFIVFVALLIMLITKSKNTTVHFFLSIILLVVMVVSFALDQENLTIH